MIVDRGDGLIYAAPAELSRLLHVPTSTVRRWACEDRWPRLRHRGRVLYLLGPAKDRARRRHARKSHA